MKDEAYHRATVIRGEIAEIESFLWKIEKVRKGKLVVKEQTVVFKAISYGAIESTEYALSNDMKELFVEIVQLRLNKLKDELYGL